MGISFTEYLIRFRLNKACELLEVSEMPIQEVALRVGYPDSVQFSKISKSIREWRRETTKPCCGRNNTRESRKNNHKFFLQQKCYINTIFSNQNIFFTFSFVLRIQLRKGGQGGIQQLKTVAVLGTLIPKERSSSSLRNASKSRV